MNEAEDQIIDNFLNEICFLFPEVKRKMDSHDVFMATSKLLVSLACLIEYLLTTKS